MTITPCLTTNNKLLEHFRRLNEYAERAQKTIDLLPEFDWNIKIDTWGYVDLETINLAKARQALTEAGFTNSNDSCFFFNNNCMISLQEPA